MPLMKCTKDGKSGWKFGQSGRCYTGPNAKEQAKKQGRAIKRSQQQSQALEDFAKSSTQKEFNSLLGLNLHPDTRQFLLLSRGLK